MLTSGAFLHRAYFHAYWRTQPNLVRQWIDRVRNCEDIAMAFLVADLSRRPPIRVAPVKEGCASGSRDQRIFALANFPFSALQLPPPPLPSDGLSSRKQHYRDRATCIEIFVSHYGYNPLITSTKIWRAD